MRAPSLREANAIIVLLVEDNDDLREFFCAVLRQQGFDVRIAADGLQALYVIGTVQPDIIVLDLQLPRVPGADVLAELEARADTRHIPVLVVTGTDDVPTNDNVRGRLRKPVLAYALVTNVWRCLSGCRRA